MRLIRGDAAVDVSILFGAQDVGLLETMVVGGARACRLAGPCAAPFAAGRAAPGGRALAAACGTGFGGGGITRDGRGGRPVARPDAGIWPRPSSRQRPRPGPP